jgi:potassium-dependent mechanosensitive channel
MKLLKKLPMTLLVLLQLTLPLPALAQEPQGSPAAATPQAAAAPSYPGMAEVVPRLSKLTENAGSAQARVNKLRDQSAFTESLRQARDRQEALQRRLEQLGDPATWSIDRLLDIRGALAEQRSSIQKLLDSISQSLSELDGLRATWEKNKAFWQAWEKDLRGQGLALPLEAFAKARETSDALLGHVAKVFALLVGQQSDVTALQEQILGELKRIDSNLDALRRKTFTKTAPSFFNLSFYRQFDADLWSRVRQGAGSRSRSAGYFRDQGWLLLVQVGLVLILGLFIRSQRSNPQFAAEWRFILKHPWATGTFVAVSGLGFLYPAPPALWRLLLWGLAVGSASLLVAGLLENRRKIFMVFYLAGLFLVSLMLQTVTLPQPLYRLYLALATLSSIPLMLTVAKRNQHFKQGKGDLFVFALRAGSLLFFAAFATQAGGYAVLASRLFEASLETVFLWLMTAMVIRLARGGVEFLFSRRLLQKSRFIRRAGNDLAARLKGVFDVFVVGYAVFYLLVVWGLFDSVPQAWGWLLEFGFHWGETFISVQMILFSALVIYLSIVISWGLRAILEWEVFPRKGMDRGVRDAIKKLLHYTLVFLGFLLALSLAGIDLKNFAVLAGALGIGIGFGLQNIVSNFVSGIILLFERPIKVGDMVVIENEWGTVAKIGLRSTVVETIDHSEIIVPNSDLVSQKVTNWTLSNKMARVTLPVGVAYGSDLTKVLKILLESAENSEGILEDPAPSAIFTGFGNSSLDFELRVWISDIVKRLVVRSELGQYVDRRFREEGVEIPFPQRDLHLRSVASGVSDRLGSASAAPLGKTGVENEDGGQSS